MRQFAIISESIALLSMTKISFYLYVIMYQVMAFDQGNRILLPKNKLCSEFIGPASHFEFASHAGFLGV